MKKGMIFLYVMVMISFCQLVCFSAPVQMPLDMDEGNSSNIINLVGEYDSLVERGLDVASGSIENAEISSLRAVGQFDLDSVTGNLYASIGNASGIEYKAKLNGSDVQFKLDDALAWGVGITFELSKDNDTFLRNFIDLSYRSIAPDYYESVTVGGVESSGTALDPKLRAGYSEFQAALGVCKKIGNFIPYGGVTISRVDVRAEATIGGTPYCLTTNSDQMFSAFGGCKLIVNDQISLEAQARAGAEEAVTVRGVYSF